MKLSPHAQIKTCASDMVHFLTYLVDIVVIYGGVEARVQVIKEVDHLEWCRVRGDGGESNNVRKVDCHFGKLLRIHWKS